MLKSKALLGDPRPWVQVVGLVCLAWSDEVGLMIQSLWVESCFDRPDSVGRCGPAYNRSGRLWVDWQSL